MNKKLYRSRDQRMWAGVCGGIAEYFDIDVTLVRLLWAIACIPSLGTAFIIYIIASIIIPQRPYGASQHTEFVDANWPEDKKKAMTIIGIALVAIGGMALISAFIPSVWMILKNGFWPAIIIIIGVVLLYSAWKNRE